MDKPEGLELAKRLAQKLFPGEWRAHDVFGHELCVIGGSSPLAVFGPKISERPEPFLALNCAVATGLPVTTGLYEFINTVNGDAWFGSCHLMVAQDGTATAIYSLLIPLEPVSWANTASIQWIMTMTNSAMGHARTIAPDLTGRFGGRPFPPQAVDTLVMMT